MGPKVLEAAEEVLKSVKAWRREYEQQKKYIEEKCMGGSCMGDKIDGGDMTAQQERISDQIAEDVTCQSLLERINVAMRGVQGVKEFDELHGDILMSLILQKHQDSVCTELNISRARYYRNKKQALVELAPRIFGEIGR